MRACDHGNKKLVKLYLEYGANPNITANVSSMH